MVRAGSGRCQRIHRGTEYEITILSLGLELGLGLGLEGPGFGVELVVL